MRTLTNAFCLLSLLAGATAQSQANLIGITLTTPLIHQAVHGTCTQITNCPALSLPPTTSPHLPGGSAWDASSDALWATTGTLIGRFDVTSCAVQCGGPFPCPRTPASEASGLDLHDGTNRLWIVDDLGGVFECTNACPPVVLNSWNNGLFSGTVRPSAISIDEARGLIFYGTMDAFSTSGSGTIHVALLSSPNIVFQSTPAIDCFTNQNLLTGLAADGGASVLYWTNGRDTRAQSYTYNSSGPSVTFSPPTCCVMMTPLLEPYIDLSIKWGGATSTGSPCANGACAPCPMVHVLRNAPLNSTVLQLGLDFAEPFTFALCLVNLGSCASAGPTIPPFCGPFLVPVLAPASPLVLGAYIPVGSGPCSASATALLPLPGPSFVGTPLASQWVSLCLPTGTAMSNCLSWVLQ
jgi:hypothetical protein